MRNKEHPPSDSARLRLLKDSKRPVKDAQITSLLFIREVEFLKDGYYVAIVGDFQVWSKRVHPYICIKNWLDKIFLRYQYHGKVVTLVLDLDRSTYPSTNNFLSL